MCSALPLQECEGRQTSNQARTRRKQRSLLCCSIYLAKKVLPVFVLAVLATGMQAHGTFQSSL